MTRGAMDRQAMTEHSVTFNQTHGLRSGRWILDSSDTLGIVDQRLPLRGINTVQAHLGGVALTADQHLHQQGVALVARLRGRGRVGSVDFIQSQARLVIQNVGQRQVAAGVQVIGRQGLGIEKSVLSAGGMSEQSFGDAQSREGSHAVQARCGAGEQRLSSLGIAKAQLRRSQPKLAMRIIRVQCQRLLEGAFGAYSIATYQLQLAQPVPRFDTGTRFLSRAQIESSRGAVVAALVNIVCQFHQAAVASLVDWRGRGSGAVVACGACGECEAGGEKHQPKSNGAEQIRYSQCTGQLAERGGHSNGVHEGGRIARLRKLVICAACVWLRRIRRVSASALCAVGLLSVIPEASAQDQPEWASRPYAYVVIDQDVRGVLQAFGRNLGVPMVISAKVKGRAPANFRAANAGAFLDKLTTNNTLTWFSDGNMLYVDSEDDLQIRNFEAVGLSAKDLQASLDELGVSGKHLHVRNSFQGDGLMVSGPPAFMALVQQRIEQIARPEPGSVAVREHGVRVFRGSAASELVEAKSKQ